MNLTELQNAVYTETNRPDLISETLQAVLASTLAMHTLDFFPDDILTGQLTFDTPLYIQQFDIGTLPRFRKMAYARKNDPTLQAFQLNPQTVEPVPNGVGIASLYERLAFIEFLAPDDIFDDFGYLRTNMGYRAGRNIIIRSNTSFQYLLTGWYARPDIAVATYSSWIADEFPYAIVYDAAATVLSDIGMVDTAREMRRVGNDTTNGGKVDQQIKIILANKLLVGAP